MELPLNDERCEHRPVMVHSLSGTQLYIECEKCSQRYVFVEDHTCPVCRNWKARTDVKTCGWRCAEARKQAKKERRS